MNIDSRSELSVEEFRRLLCDDGVLRNADAELTPLTGGVSSDIWRVADGDELFVVKRALPQLRVAATWLANPQRNRYEVEYLKSVRQFAPRNVPEVYHHHPEHGYFTMEWLGPEFCNWKSELLGGRGELAQARIAGGLLGRIHRETWGDSSLQESFDTTPNFFELRAEPYLLATAERHPALAKLMRAEADRVLQARDCLVHGDYSPKNLLFAGDRIMALDCEVAWFGDAAFDVAFLLNHLTIKALHLRDARRLDWAEAAWMAYRDESGHQEIETTVGRLLPMLMLARVDGKSPLEYLREDSRQAIRDFTSPAILEPAEKLMDLWQRWRVFLDAHAHR